MGATLTDLTVVERKQLAELEQVIERGMATFVEVGAALTTIRDDRLYRDAYDSFSAYCADRWGRSRAYQLIDAADAVLEVAAAARKGNGAPTIFGARDLPTNESQAAELAKAPEGKRAEAWAAAREAAATGADGTPKVTAAGVRAAVEQVTTPPTPAKPKGGGGKPKAAAKDEPPAAGADAAPWAAFESQVEGIAGKLRSVGRELGEVLGYDAGTKQLKNRWAHYYTHAGTVGHLNQLVRNLTGGLPVEAAPGRPGYVSAELKKVRDSASKSSER